MTSQPLRVGVIGCGGICGAYFSMAKNFPQIQIGACADLILEKAQAAATTYGIQWALTVEELLRDPAIDVVLNLTVPKAHAEISLAALNAGKHVYSEKPLGISREQGEKIISLARSKSLRVGCAPDTFFGAGHQTARKLIDDGAIGKPVAFTAFMMGRGHEHWHASPEFFYQPGAGPMFDMGPYYLTALINLLGDVKRISGMTSIAIPQRTISSEPLRGKTFSVTTADHVTGLMEFENGCVGSIIQSFAMRGAKNDGKSPITIFGDRGTLRVPDPNGFDGPVFLCDFSLGDEFVEVPPAFAKGYGRAVGLAEMAEAISGNRKHRANGDLAFAVLELMQGFEDSSREEKYYRPIAKGVRPAALKPGDAFGDLS